VSLCRLSPEAYDFTATFRELEKLYRKRDTNSSLARVLIAQGALRERAYDIEGAEQVYLEALKLAPDQYPVVDALVSLHERLRRFDAGSVVLEAFIERAKDVSSKSSARYRLAEILRRRGDGSQARGHHARGAARRGSRSPRRLFSPGAGAVPARPLRRGAPRMRGA